VQNPEIARPVDWVDSGFEFPEPMGIETYGILHLASGRRGGLAVGPSISGYGVGR
jgi:hypothetical protein